MIIDSIDNIKTYSTTFPYMPQIASIVQNIDIETIEDGNYTTDYENIRYFVSTYRLEEGSREIYEVHRDETDIQWVLQGCERIDIAWRDPVKIVKEYVPDIFWVEGKPCTSVSLDEGKFVLLLPGEPHAPQLIADRNVEVRKVVFKITIR